MRTPSRRPAAVLATASDSAAGAYLAVVGGGNDCHTANSDQTQGRIPEAERLAGSDVGDRRTPRAVPPGAAPAKAPSAGRGSGKPSQ